MVSQFVVLVVSVGISCFSLHVAQNYFQKIQYIFYNDVLIFKLGTPLKNNKISCQPSLFTETSFLDFLFLQILLQQGFGIALTKDTIAIIKVLQA